MFQLTIEEFASLRFQIETLESSDPLRSQIVTLKQAGGQHRKYLPNAFNEQGVAMLSGILNSKRAINRNIAVMRAFVEIRRVILQQNDVKSS